MTTGSAPTDVGRALEPYRRRLTAEAWLRAGLYAAACGGAAGVCMGILRLFLPRIGRGIVLLMALGVCLVTLPVLFLLRFRPDDRGTARRIDALGLSDRVSTMYEYRADVSPSACLQRRDALRALNGVVPEEIQITIPRRVGWASAVLCAAAVVLLLLPAVPARALGGEEAESSTQPEGETLLESGIASDVEFIPSEAGGDGGDGAAVNNQSSSQDGGNTDGGDEERAAGNGNDLHGTTAMKESVYDPGQHATLPYGDVYASYYIAWEKTADNLPDRVNDAMRDYLDKLKDRKEE